MFDIDRRHVLLSTVATASTGTTLWAVGSRSFGTAAKAAERGSMTETAGDEATATGQQDRDDDQIATDGGSNTETGTVSSDTEPEDGTESLATVEFLDCETVRVTESVDDVLLSLFWWDEQGLIGTISEPVGSVDDERTVSATETFGEFAYGPIVTEVELFHAGTPVVPGGGDVLVSNPDVDSCVASIREAAAGTVALEETGFEPSASTAENQPE